VTSLWSGSTAYTMSGLAWLHPPLINRSEEARSRRNQEQDPQTTPRTTRRQHGMRSTLAVPEVSLALVLP
jgi:hypothetical protein